MDETGLQGGWPVGEWPARTPGSQVHRTHHRNWSFRVRLREDSCVSGPVSVARATGKMLGRWVRTQISRRTPGSALNLTSLSELANGRARSPVTCVQWRRGRRAGCDLGGLPCSESWLGPLEQGVA